VSTRPRRHIDSIDTGRPHDLVSAAAGVRHYIDRTYTVEVLNWEERGSPTGRLAWGAPSAKGGGFDRGAYEWIP
jgi:hypothetical protein